MPKLLAITGLAGSGKDTIADYLWEEYGYLKIAFADPLKAAAAAMFGLDVEAFYDRELKERPVEPWGTTPRRLLQLLGTEATKPVFGPDIWIKRFGISYDMVRETDDVVIPDCRFNLEAEAIRAMGGVVVHLVRPGAGAPGEAAQHVSEAGVDILPQDYVLSNDGTLEDLYGKVETLLLMLEAGDE